MNVRFLSLRDQEVASSNLTALLLLKMAPFVACVRRHQSIQDCNSCQIENKTVIFGVVVFTFAFSYDIIYLNGQ